STASVPPRFTPYAAAGSVSAAPGSATAARWTTASGATSSTTRATPATSRTSPGWKFSGAPISRAGACRASPCTLWPCFARARTAAGPAKPETPVTNTRIAVNGRRCRGRTASPEQTPQAFEIGADSGLHARGKGSPPCSAEIDEVAQRGRAGEQIDSCRPDDGGTGLAGPAPISP